ncbi:MAG: hypothetical protein HY826_03350 [Actinobacteria bacterium]|nr:hypothetical protein [Actinomycetota bacterium]
MTALDSVRRKRTTMILGMNVAALVAIAGIGYVGATALRHYEGAKKVGREFLPLPVTTVGLLAIADDTGRLAGATLVVSLAGDLPGGYVLPLPTSVDSTLGQGEERIALTADFAQGGIESLGLAVESVLGVTLDLRQVVTPTEAEALFQSVAPVTVTLPREVRDTVDDAQVVQFPSGEAALSPAQVVQVLTAEVTGEAESARRDNINAVWAAVAAATGAGIPGWVAGSPVATVADLLSRAMAGPMSSRPFATVPIAPELNPAGLDVEQLDRPEAVMVLATVAPGSMSTPALGLTYRVQAPPGYVEEMKAAVAVLLYLGANVRSVDFSGPVMVNSVALLSTEDEQERAAVDNAVFGTLEFVVNPNPIEGIDVVLQLGTDYLGQGPAALPSTTTTTSIP